MNERIILTLAELSLCGGAIIAVLALLRNSLGTLISRRVSVLLWLVAAIRMLVPLSIELTIPIAVEPSSPTQTSTAQNTTDTLADRVQFEPNPSASAEDASVYIFAVAVWAVGAVVCAGIFVASERRLRARLAASGSLCDGDTVRHFEALRAELLPYGKVALYKTSAIDSPMAIGLFRSEVYLPEHICTDVIDSERLSLVLSHELCHIKRGDLVFKRIFCAAAVIHWFNPLAWLMVRLASRDIELACDEAVLAKSPDLRRRYALCLIESEELRCTRTAAFGGSALSERIEAIMKNNTKKLTLMGVAGICALSVATMMMFVRATPEYIEESDSDTVQAVAVDEDDKVVVTEIKPAPATESESVAAVEPSNDELLLPLSCEYEITLAFGTHTSPIRTLFHDGIDLAAAEGSEILAVKDGTVLETVYHPERGTYVKLDHGDGLYSLYQHCQKYTVKVGDKVSAGDVIALVGRTGAATGAHLHFSMMQGEDYIDVNPMFE